MAKRGRKSNARRINIGEAQYESAGVLIIYAGACELYFETKNKSN